MLHGYYAIHINGILSVKNRKKVRNQPNSKSCVQGYLHQDDLVYLNGSIRNSNLWVCIYYIQESRLCEGYVRYRNVSFVKSHVQPEMFNLHGSLEKYLRTGSLSELAKLIAKEVNTSRKQPVDYSAKARVISELKQKFLLFRR